jgi:hypothetical protein
MSKIMELANAFVTASSHIGPASAFAQGAELQAEVSRVEAELAALKAEKVEREKQEPMAWQYQDRNGVWCSFIHEKHRLDTVADGTWPIRALYLAPGAGSVPMTDAETYLKQINGAASRDWLIGWDDCVAHHKIGVKT